MLVVNVKFKIRNCSYCCNLFCSRSKGRILSDIWEYFTFAFTQAAKGAAATDARFADLSSNDSPLFVRSFSTANLFSVLILLASKDLQNT